METSITTTEQDYDGIIMANVIAHLSGSNQNANISLESLAEKLTKSHPIDIYDAVYISAHSTGVLLNAILFTALVWPASMKRDEHHHARSHFVFVTLLTIAHLLFCLSHLAELIYLKFYNIYSSSMTTCIRVIQSRGITSLWYLLTIGAVLGCAFDNYFAVCKPIRYRLHNNCITKFYTTISVAFFLVSFLVSFFDFYSTAGLRDDCYVISEKAASINMYCQRIKDCHRSVIENAVIFVWLVSVVFCVSFYAKTIQVLRLSMKDFFPPTSPKLMKTSTINENQPSMVVVAREQQLIIIQQDSNKALLTPDGNESRLQQRAASLAFLQSPAWSRVNVSNESLPTMPAANIMSDMKRNNSKVSSTSSRSRSSSAATCHPNSPASQRMQMFQYRRRFSNVLIVILMVFLVTWLPSMLLQIANEFFFTEQFRINEFPKYLNSVTHFRLLLASSAIIDPIIYGRSFLSTSFIRRRSENSPKIRSVTHRTVISQL